MSEFISVSPVWAKRNLKLIQDKTGMAWTHMADGSYSTVRGKLFFGYYDPSGCLSLRPDERPGLMGLRAGTGAYLVFNKGEVMALAEAFRAYADEMRDIEIGESE